MTVGKPHYALGTVGPSVAYDPPFEALGVFLSAYTSLALEAIVERLRLDEHASFADNAARLDREGDTVELLHEVFSPPDDQLLLAFDDFIEAAGAFVAWMRSQPPPPCNSRDIVLAEWLTGQTSTTRARRRLFEWLLFNGVTDAMSDDAVERWLADAVADLGGAEGIAHTLGGRIARRELDARRGAATLALLGAEPFVALAAEAEHGVGQGDLTREVEWRIDETAKRLYRV